MKEKDYSKYDYPACIVACTCSNHPNKIYTERSAKTKIDRYQKTILIEKLLSLGEYGEETEKEDSRIGYCAEQRVAATVLKDYSDLSISDLKFSKAVRPRTAKIIPYCQNCKSIFPQLNHE